jgi:hypothetical protein
MLYLCIFLNKWAPYVLDYEQDNKVSYIIQDNKVSYIIHHIDNVQAFDGLRKSCHI